MVEVGSKLAKDQGFTNLEYRIGDLEEPPISDNSIDLAIFSQALHHANSPQKAIAAARRILRDGGRLIILDLLAHGFEQARELYADLWLGFSEVELFRLLDQAGFRENDVKVVYREPNSPHVQTVLATTEEMKRQNSGGAGVQELQNLF
jgi:ArsR family transcriptional regulator